ncbi:MAG: hypothetical protein IRY90_03535 [Actinomadura rubrobrunea]|nr:hypothetical protein [Actinomadura rubrobrunea]
MTPVWTSRAGLPSISGRVSPICCGRSRAGSGCGSASGSATVGHDPRLVEQRERQIEQNPRFSTARVVGPSIDGQDDGRGTDERGPTRCDTFRWDLEPTDYVFKPGHRIGVVILSTDHDYTLRYSERTRLTVRSGNQPGVGVGNGAIR